MTVQTLPVVVAPVLSSPRAHSRFEVAQGQTLAEIINLVLPHFTPDEWPSLRVTLSLGGVTCPVDARYWHRVRPNAQVRVAIRTVPGRDNLNTILLAVVSVAAISLGQAWAVALIPQAGLAQTALGALIGAGISVLGSLAVNALVPLQSPANDAEKARQSFAITGWRNEARPGSPVPLILGRVRYAPPFAAQSYTEVVGDDLYVRALFCFGHGPIQLSDFRLGDTSTDDYDDIELEVREGYDTDAPVSIYRRQVLEESTGVQLVRPLDRDDQGEVIEGGGSTVTPVVRITAADTHRASIILGFPSGLFEVDDEGDVIDRSVSIRIQQRELGDNGWSEVKTLTFSEATRTSFFRQHSWTLPSRGQWEIQITRMTVETVETQISDTVVLSAVQSIRPEYPINLDTPLALAALRIRATYQLNGALENFNALCRRIGPKYQGGDVWADETTRSPVGQFLIALQGPQNPYPVGDAEIDWDQMQDWHDFCTSKGLHYNKAHDQGETLGEMLAAICAAGRAFPRHDGVRWGVVIDQPQDFSVYELNPRNSDQFSWSQSYIRPPDGFRVPFLDQDNDYRPAERIVPWPGHVGPVDLTEVLELPGKTNADEVWIEARRRMYELIHRPDRLQLIQDGGANPVTRGDLVRVSHSALDRVQVAGRVKSVRGRLVVLDTQMTFEDGTDYAIRFRSYSDDADTTGTSRISQVTGSGVSDALEVALGDRVPVAGDLVNFGLSGQVTLAARVLGVEAGEGFSRIIHMVRDASEIDTLTDAEVPPAFDGRVGEVIAASTIAPTAPKIRSVRTVGATDDTPGNVMRIHVRPGTGSTAVVAAYEFDHRVSASGGWSTITADAGEGRADIGDYVIGDDIELRVRAVSIDGVQGAYTGILPVTVGEDGIALPAALDDDTIMVDGSRGHTDLRVWISNDANTRKLAIYRAPTGVSLNRTTHAIGEAFEVQRRSTVVTIDGDGTRDNQINEGSFPSDDEWVLGGNWTVGNGKVTHSPGAADSVSQATSLNAGRFYRLTYKIKNHVAGNVTARFDGGTVQSGSAGAATGQYTERLEALAGNNTLTFAASSDFDGAVDNVVLFRETAASVDAGTYDYYFEPQTALGFPGPVSGPFTTTII